MRHRIDVPTLRGKHQYLVPLLARDLRTEGFPKRTVEMLAAVTSAYLATEDRFPVSMVTAATQQFLDDVQAGQEYQQEVMHEIVTMGRNGNH